MPASRSDVEEPTRDAWHADHAGTLDVDQRDIGDRRKTLDHVLGFA